MMTDSRRSRVQAASSSGTSRSPRRPQVAAARVSLALDPAWTDLADLEAIAAGAGVVKDALGRIPGEVVDLDLVVHRAAHDAARRAIRGLARARRASRLGRERGASQKLATARGRSRRAPRRLRSLRRAAHELKSLRRSGGGVAALGRRATRLGTGAVSAKPQKSARRATSPSRSLASTRTLRRDSRASVGRTALTLLPRARNAGSEATMELRRWAAVGPACLLGFITLLLLAGSADASALTTMVPHGERSCFYALVDKVGEKGAPRRASVGAHGMQLASIWLVCALDQRRSLTLRSAGKRSTLSATDTCSLAAPSISATRYVRCTGSG